MVEDAQLLELLALRASTLAATGQLTFRRRDGSTFPVELTSGLLPAGEGAPVSFVMFRDITERRRTEARLRRSNRALRLVIVCNEALVRATTEEGLFAEVCKAMVETGGYRMCWVGLAERDERQTVRPVSHAGHDDGYLATLDLVWSDTLRGRGPTGTAVRTGRTIIGHDFAVDPELAPWRDEALRRGYRSSTALPLVHAGERLGVLTMYAGDVETFDEAELEILSQLSSDLAYGVHALRQRAARAAAEEALRGLQAQFLQAQKMEAIGSLAGGVAHDFNNLLTVILSYAGFMAEALRDGDPVKDDLLEVQRAGERAVALTRQLLAFSRKQVLQPEVLSLNQIASGLENMLQRILGEDIELRQTLAPELGLTLADPGQLEQVLMNLVVNARDAMPRGGTLTIATANVELDAQEATLRGELPPGPYVQLAVTDTGTGMDEATRSRIFEPFFTTKEKGKGTGLGLSTAYGIVKQSRGHIGVASALGRGTTVTIHLPRERAAGAARSVKPAARSPLVRGSETILVVEDQDALRKVVQRALEAAHYRVLTAADGDEGLLTSARHPGEIDLVLTDVVMPRMSGSVLAQQLATQRPNLNVLYMSGYNDDAVVNHGVADVGMKFLAKPFTADELVRKVREVLDSPVGQRYADPEP